MDDDFARALQDLSAKQAEMEARLAWIEAALRLKRTPAQPIQAAAPPSVSPDPPPPPAQAAPLSAPTEPPAPAPSPERLRFEGQVGLTLMNRVGVITLVLGVAFFFKWAVDNQWIGPAARVILGLIAGAATLAAADWLWQRGQRVFSQGVTAAGLAILYIALYAAFSFYHLIGQALDFIALASVTALGIALAFRYGSIAMAALGLSGGYLTPLLLTGANDGPWVLFGFVLVLNIAGILLTRPLASPALPVLSIVWTGIVYLFWHGHYFVPEDRAVATLFVLANYALFWFAPSWLALCQIGASIAVAVIWREAPGTALAFALVLQAAGSVARYWRQAPATALAAVASFWVAVGLIEPLPLSVGLLGASLGFALGFGGLPALVRRKKLTIGAEELVAIALNSAAYFAVVYCLLDTHHHSWRGPFTALLAILHLLLGRMLRGNARTLLFAIAVVLITLFVPIQFSGYRIAIGWSLEALTLVYIHRRVAHLPYESIATMIFALAALHLLIVEATVPAGRLLAFSVVATCLWIASQWTDSLLYYAAGHIVALLGIVLQVLDWIPHTATPEGVASLRTLLLSIVFALYGVVFVAVGFATSTSRHRTTGLLVLGSVVVKLYVFDVWLLDRSYRIAAFIALGILLLTTSYLYSRRRKA